MKRGYCGINMFLNRNHFFFAFIVWFGLFSGTYNISGFGFYPPLLMSLFGYFYYIFIKQKIPKYVVPLLLLFFFLFLLFITTTVVNDTFDEIFFIEFRYIIKSLFIPIGFSLAALQYIKKNNFNSIDISKTIVLVGIYQFSLVVIQLLNYEFRQWFFSLITLSKNWKFMAEMGHFRAVGLAGLSIYDTSIAYSLLFSCTISLIGKHTESNNIRLWTLGLVLYLVLIFLSGRTGLIIFSVIIFFILHNTYNKSKVYFYIFIILFIATIIVINLIDIEYLLGLFDFAFEFFNNKGGNFESESTNDFLENHLYIPWNTNFLIGDGFWAQPSVSNKYNYEYSTDSGFILLFISSGLFGLLFSIYITYRLIKLYFNSYIYQYNYNLINLIVKISLAILIILVVLKGPIYFSERFMSVMIFNIMIYNYMIKHKGRL